MAEAATIAAAAAAAAPAAAPSAGAALDPVGGGPAALPKSDPANRDPQVTIGAEPSLAPKTLINDGDPKPEPKPDASPVTFDVKQLKLPEGLTVDSLELSKFGEIIGNTKLSPKERGEALLGLYAESAKAVGEANTKLWNDLNSQWRDEVKADKEIGGDKFQPTLQTISKALDTLEPDLAKGFRLALDFTGAGNNPYIVRGLAQMARVLTEGGHVPGGPGSGKQNMSTVFFPNSPEFSEQKGNG